MVRVRVRVRVTVNLNSNPNPNPNQVGPTGVVSASMADWSQLAGNGLQVRVRVRVRVRLRLRLRLRLRARSQAGGQRAAGGRLARLRGPTLTLAPEP